MGSPENRPLRLHISGRPTLADAEGRVVNSLTRKDLLLLTILANEPNKLWDRWGIASIVWPEAKPESARLSLRGSLKALRKVLPPQAIRSIGSMVCLAANTVEFEPLESGEGLESEFFPSGWNHPWLLNFRRSRMAEPTGRVRLAASSCDEEEGFNEPFRLPGHPLPAAARYLLDEEPKQAVEFVASTRNHWGAVPIAEAIEVFGRVLPHCRIESNSRRRIEAMAILLHALNGSRWASDEKILAALNREIREQDTENMILICTALAIASQQNGQLDRACRFAKTRARVLANSHSAEASARGSFFVANMERHNGQYEDARKRNLEALRAFKELGSAEDIALASLTASTDALLARDFDKAEAHVRQSQHLFEETKNGRLRPWSEMAKAFLLESTGNLAEARAILLTLRDQGPSRSGQSFRAGVEDHLLRVDSQLGEWEDSALDWATAKRIRNWLGLVTSPFERALSRPAKQQLKKRVGLLNLCNLLENPQSLPTKLRH